MSTLKSIIFETLPDPEEYYETAEALRDLDRQYQHFTRTVWKASKQLLKFDEINRLVAYEVEEKTPKASTAGRSSGSSKSSSSSSKKSSTGSRSPDSDIQQNFPRAGMDADLPIHFAIKDVLFSWGDINWEQLMMKLVAGFSALTGGLAGSILGGIMLGPEGLVLGLGLGLLFGCSLDSTIFNFDGELSRDEVYKSLIAVLPPLAGTAGGFVIGGPAGAAIGLILGTSLTLKLLDVSWSDVLHSISLFFEDLNTNWARRWQSFRDLAQQSWEGIRDWWAKLSLDRFTFRLPHLTVAWQELSSDSILARYLGITAIPHLGVEWYARGGVVDGATLIGAGEQGKEAIIPLERHTEWIHMVALELKDELAKLAPASPQALRLIPAAASSMVPYAATLSPSPALEAPDLSGLASTIARAIAELGDRPQPEQQIRVYLDGKQLSDAVTRYQRSSSRSLGQ